MDGDLVDAVVIIIVVATAVGDNGRSRGSTEEAEKLTEKKLAVVRDTTMSSVTCVRREPARSLWRSAYG